MSLLNRLLCIAYSAGTSLTVWLVLVPLTLIRMLSGRAAGSELIQRLGRARPRPGTTGPLVLIHAVSVGEMVAAGVLVGALVRLVPAIRVVLTSGNRHGLEAGWRLRQKHPQILEVWLLPWDRRHALARWLDRLRPDLVAVVETELWPNLFLSCGKLRIPLCLVNGRIYPRDLATYRLARAFFKPALDCVTWFWVQSEAEKERFCQIGVSPERISVLSNLKFDAALEPGIRIDWGLSRQPVIVAGSTHPPEEDFILDASETLWRDFPGLLLVIAPRHPRRARSVCSRALQKGRTVLRLSRLTDRQLDSDVLILDRMGVLGSFYQIADVAIIGGSLAKCGGHNLLEPAAHACPIVMGPHCEHFQDIARDFQRADAFILLPDRRQLAQVLGRLLADSRLRQELGARGRAVVESRAGSADQYAYRLVQLLDPTLRSTGGILGPAEQQCQ